ncbi:hypothetical protein AWW66_16085 [Micromonospora rosaria]|uniref:Uncharacterized protein n=1 Tax=Micromonospora rosaria TaxID=47874 RepID=A0A136PRH0_9ACTN|nr:hypothetical protein AWW66_16085 [Micromonospora rosaria]
MYVFKVNGQQRLYGDRHLDLGDDTVVEAVAVSVVQQRSTTLNCELSLSSSDAADAFAVVVNFRCQVLAPELVAEAGLADLHEVLTNHLWQDREFKNLGLRHRIEDINEVRRQVDARVTAYCHLVPPSVPGMAVDLCAVVVHPSAALRDQHRRIRDKRWEQEVGRLDVSWQNEEIERYATILSAGPTYADALGVSRHEINVGQIAERMHEAEAERKRVAASVLQDMLNRGYLDRANFDPLQLIEELTGRTYTAGTEPSLGPADEPASLPPGRRPTDDTPDFIPNEADID